MQRLDGLRVLLTGGGGGIGRHIGERLRAEGARVFVTDVNESAAIASAGDPSFAASLDVTDDASCLAAVDRAVAELGGLDVLVNGAGIMVRKNALDTDLDTWQRILDVNVSGAFRMAKCAQPHLLRSPRASIVSISSTHAFLAAKNSIAYSTSKAALSHLTRLLALEWAEWGIRVNAVAPTVVPSPMTDDVLSDPAYIERKMSAIPLGKPIPPESVAAAIAYLVSEDAAATTGQIIVLDGGESLA